MTTKRMETPPPAGSEHPEKNETVRRLTGLRDELKQQGKKEAELAERVLKELQKPDSKIDAETRKTIAVLEAALQREPQMIEKVMSGVMKIADAVKKLIDRLAPQGSGSLHEVATLLQSMKLPVFALLLNNVADSPRARMAYVQQLLTKAGRTELTIPSDAGMDKFIQGMQARLTSYNNAEFAKAKAENNVQPLYLTFEQFAKLVVEGDSSARPTEASVLKAGDDVVKAKKTESDAVIEAKKKEKPAPIIAAPAGAVAPPAAAPTPAPKAS